MIIQPNLYSKGFVKISRSIQLWEWGTNPTMFYFWVRLILKANWQDEKVEGKTIPRGSMLTSRRLLAVEFKMTEKQVRNCLDKLKESGEIRTKMAGKMAMITICKYEDYQDSTEPKGQQKGQQKGQDDASSCAHENNNIYNLTANEFNKEEGEERPSANRPFEGWRYLSSVTKASLGFNPDAIAEKRKELMGAELSAIASEIGMPKEAQERFLAKWCEHNPGSDKIKADYEPTFNVRDRATQFMGWWKQKDQPKKEKQPLGEYYKDLIKNMKERYASYEQPDSSVPDEQ